MHSATLRRMEVLLNLAFRRLPVFLKFSAYSWDGYLYYGFFGAKIFIQYRVWRYSKCGTWYLPSCRTTRTNGTFVLGADQGGDWVMKPREHITPATLVGLRYVTAESI
jgi:hypothetical protein